MLLGEDHGGVGDLARRLGEAWWAASVAPACWTLSSARAAALWALARRWAESEMMASTAGLAAPAEGGLHRWHQAQ